MPEDLLDMDQPQTSHDIPPSPRFDPPQPTPGRPAYGLAAIVLLVVVFAAGVLVGQAGLFGSRAAAQTPVATGLASTAATNEGAAPSNFDLFWQALDIVRKNYVGWADVSDTDITYGAIRGMVDALGDTAHSVFLTPEEVKSEQDALNGNLVGVGILLGTSDSDVSVVSVVPDGPAQQAGIKAGDVIVAVDGQSVAGLDPAEIAAKVRGDEGTSVTISVSRPSTGEKLDFEMVRAQIRIPAVSWTMIPGTKTALLRLAQFSAGSADELKAARDEAVGAGATSLILDLRGNPGGYVDQAVQVASEFLTDKTVYIRQTANGDETPVKTSSDVSTTELPLVTLIDSNSASSAEIVAGALKSAQRGPLVGETTFGTGTVLLPFELADGSTIRLAVERWLTPDGELIFGKGITPTDEVALTDGQAPLEPDQIRDLSPDQVSSISDAQLLHALNLLH